MGRVICRSNDNSFSFQLHTILDVFTTSNNVLIFLYDKSIRIEFSNRGRMIEQTKIKAN
jgi:hypothetical protein